MARTCRHQRSGFSLVELLTVIAIVGLLAALLIPAIQSAREAARRTKCISNLRQIGIGLQSYHSLNHAFPPGGIEWRGGGDLTKRQLAWSAFLLPFIDRQPLYERLDLSTPFDSAENSQAAATVIPVYVCPSSSNGSKLIDGRGPCQYGGIHGERITSPNDPPKGIMIYDRAIRGEEIVDGLSHTIIAAEDSIWPEGQWINGRNVFDQAFGINNAPTFENDIRSSHPGGANVLLADSSVAFFNESMDLYVVAAFCTRAGFDAINQLGKELQ